MTKNQQLAIDICWANRNKAQVQNANRTAKAEGKKPIGKLTHWRGQTENRRLDYVDLARDLRYNIKRLGRDYILRLLEGGA